MYWLYGIWTCLYENYEEYVERPFFFDRHLKEQYLFHCNFENVDKNRFPSMREKYEKEPKTSGSQRMGASNRLKIRPSGTSELI